MDTLEERLTKAELKEWAKEHRTLIIVVLLTIGLVTHLVTFIACLGVSIVANDAFDAGLNVWWMAFVLYAIVQLQISRKNNKKKQIREAEKDNNDWLPRKEENDG